jgi:hypothetical protein
MSDAIYVRGRHETRKTAVAAIAAGEVHQLPDGRAAVYTGQDAAAIGDRTNWKTDGQHTVTKSADLVFTKGAPVYWDHSANAAVLFPASDKDFFLGTCMDDVAAATLTAVVNLNVRPTYKIEMGRNDLSDEFLTVVVKTVVGSTTVEVPDVKLRPGAACMLFGATAEAQKVDLLSQQGFAVGSNWIVEGGFNIIDDGDAAAIDFNVGVANATHATDADAITESCFLHLDGNALDLFAESDDGTTEVAATDAAVNIALGTPVHFVIDGRNLADIQIYVNGVLMLGSTVFKLDAATGPLKLLAHLEKTSDDTTADYRVNYLRVRTMEQD